jgi:hypothetical protein
MKRAELGLENVKYSAGVGGTEKVGENSVAFLALLAKERSLV